MRSVLPVVVLRTRSPALSLPRVDAEVGELADVRVGHDLEGERRERLVVGAGRAVDSSLGLRVDARASAGRRAGSAGSRSTASSSGCTPLFLKARAEQHRRDLVGERRRRGARAGSCSGVTERLVLEVRLEHLVVEVRRSRRSAGGGTPAPARRARPGCRRRRTSGRGRPCRRSPSSRRGRRRRGCSSSWPIGIWIGTGFAPRRSRIDCTAAKKFAPVRSILLMNAIRGTLVLVGLAPDASRTAAATPATESKTATAPSRTRRLRSTSTVKSTCPGVSMMLIRWSRQYAVVAADVIVMPRSCSCAIQSIVAAPSCTSPILWVRPV